MSDVKFMVGRERCEQRNMKGTEPQKGYGKYEGERQEGSALISGELSVYETILCRHISSNHFQKCRRLNGSKTCFFFDSSRERAIYILIVIKGSTSPPFTTNLSLPMRLLVR
jgi:hypothetical protein